MTATAKHDPLSDPQPGDTIFKISESTGLKHTRTVTKRVNNDITYRTHDGKVRTCWITSWMDWARMAEVEAK